MARSKGRKERRNQNRKDSNLGNKKSSRGQKRSASQSNRRMTGRGSGNTRGSGASANQTTGSRSVGTSGASLPKPNTPNTARGSSGVKPGITINGDPRLSGPKSQPKLSAPGSMKDVTPKPKPPAKSSGGGSGGYTPSIPSTVGRMLGRAGGAIGAILVPTRMADGTVKNPPSPQKPSMSKPTGGGNRRGSNKPSAPSQPIPKARPDVSGLPSPPTPELSDSDVLNKLSARGVDQRTINRAPSMQKLRQLEKDTRGLKKGKKLR